MLKGTGFMCAFLSFDFIISPNYI